MVAVDVGGTLHFSMLSSSSGGTVAELESETLAAPTVLSASGVLSLAADWGGSLSAGELFVYTPPTPTASSTTLSCDRPNTFFGPATGLVGAAVNTGPQVTGVTCVDLENGLFEWRFSAAVDCSGGTENACLVVINQEAPDGNWDPVPIIFPAASNVLSLVGSFAVGGPDFVVGLRGRPWGFGASAVGTLTVHGGGSFVSSAGVVQ